MRDVVVLVPMRAVAIWIADFLKSYGHRSAAAISVAELSRLMLFVRFDAVVTWLPPDELDALATILQTHCPFRPSLVILSFTSTEFSATPSWFRKDRDRVIRLPVSPSALLSKLGDVPPLEFADDFHTGVGPTPGRLVSSLPYLSSPPALDSSPTRAGARHEHESAAADCWPTPASLTLSVPARYQS